MVGKGDGEGEGDPARVTEGNVYALEEEEGREKEEMVGGDTLAVGFLLFCLRCEDNLDEVEEDWVEEEV